MNIAAARVLAYAEAISHVRGYTRRSKKGKQVNVRSYVKNYEAVDERGNSVEVDGNAYDIVDKYLSGDNTLQDLIDGYTTGREDFKVGNIEVLRSQEGEALNIAGLIMDSKGTAVGEFNRVLDFEGKTVEHGAFMIVPEQRNKGIATDLNINVFAMYRKLGFDAVTTYADGGRGVNGVGRYAWAMQGFDFASSRQAGMIKLDFAAYLKEKGLNDTAEAVMKMQHSWEIASTTVNGHKMGKEFMILTGPNWDGVMKLGKNKLSSKVFEVYAKNSKGKERK